jgi:tellurite resistance protein TehA-like permease
MLLILELIYVKKIQYSQFLAFLPWLIQYIFLWIVYSGDSISTLYHPD